uniref:Major facilitator superfamily (MFS) profile domain-containing protein n=1 Tax=Aplanochytrium stocchinoi TaxID=215587 RepID=A0A7S3PFS4_9STRA
MYFLCKQCNTYILRKEEFTGLIMLLLQRGLCCFLAYDDPPKLTQNQWSILAIAGISNLFRSYDGLVSTVAVSQIQEDLHISEEDIGLVYAAVRFGIVPALLVAMLSDIHGRRKVLLISTGIYIVFTSSTGFTTNLNQFIGFQFIAKMFSSVQNTVYSVLILEALNDENRGWAIGLYQSFSAFGGSIALMLFAVFGGFRWGWRVMYIVSFTELFLLRYMYRNLPESGIIMKAWAETVHVEERLPVNSLSLFREAVLSNLKPVYLLFLSYPKRFLGCTTIAAIDGFATAPADLFKIKFMQELHGLSPHDISMIIFVSGVGAILCFTLAGKLSDKYGRKPLLIGFKTLLTASIVLYYTVPGKWFIVFLILIMQSTFVLATVSATYFGECFPTSFRSTAIAWLGVVFTLSGSLGLVAEKQLFLVVGDHYIASACFASIGIFSIPVLVFMLPEVGDNLFLLISCFSLYSLL